MAVIVAIRLIAYTVSSGVGKVFVSVLCHVFKPDEKSLEKLEVILKQFPQILVPIGLNVTEDVVFVFQRLLILEHLVHLQVDGPHPEHRIGLCKSPNLLEQPIADEMIVFLASVLDSVHDIISEFCKADLGRKDPQMIQISQVRRVSSRN
jgi:hypothetical protein